MLHGLAAQPHPLNLFGDTHEITVAGDGVRFAIRER
jgi:hypothetical protein